MVTIYWSGVGLAAVAVTAWRPVGGRVVLSGGREAAKWLLCGGCGGRGVASWGPRDGHFVTTWWPVAAELWVVMCVYVFRFGVGVVSCCCCSVAARLYWDT